MAATIDVEIESGVYTDPIRRHRGYWAGDFSARDQASPPSWAMPDTAVGSSMR